MSMPERGTVAGVRVRVMGRGRAWVAPIRVVRVGRRGEVGDGRKVEGEGLVVAMWVRRVERMWRDLSWRGRISWGLEVWGGEGGNGLTWPAQTYCWASTL